MNKKVQAFTILEVSVSMLLAAISIAIGYTAFSIINRSYRDYDTRNKHLAELLLVDKLLKKDFSEAKVIIRSESGLSAIRDSGLVIYEFKPGFILRTQDNLRSDTIKLINEGHTYLFEHKDTARDWLVDKFKLTIILEGRKVNLLYNKIYSADELYSKFRANMAIKFISNKPLFLCLQ